MLLMKLREKNLTELQAFHAMRKFLDIFYYKTRSDDVGSLLGDLQLFPEGGTFDPAAWEEWQESVANILKTKQSEVKNLSELEALQAMRKFLQIFYENTSSEDVSLILKDTQISPDGKTDPSTWQNWKKCINEVREGKFEPYDSLL